MTGDTPTPPRQSLMCSRCRTAERFAPALGVLFDRIAAAIDANPKIVQTDAPDSASGIAATCRVLTLALNPGATPAHRAATIAALTPDQRATVRSVLDLIGVTAERVAHATGLLMRARGEALPDDVELDEDEDETPTTLANMVESGAMVATRPPETDDQRRKVQEAFQRFAKELSEITGAPVQVAHGEADGSGKIRPVGPTMTTTPGGFPMFTDPTTVH